MLAAATTFLQLRHYLVEREAPRLLPRREKKNHLGLASSNGKNGHCGLANGDLQ
jgi:hypothetical protein